MKFKQWINYFQLIFFLGVAIICFGCSKEAQEFKETYSTKIIFKYEDQEKNHIDAVWPDSQLKERFAEYWYKRFAGGIDELWLMEAPHFRFMADLQKYENYLARSMAQMPITVEVKEIDEVTDHKVLVSCEIIFSRSGENHSVSLEDRWVFVENEWFHILRDPLIFPFTVR